MSNLKIIQSCLDWLNYKILFLTLLAFVLFSSQNRTQCTQFHWRTSWWPSWKPVKNWEARNLIIWWSRWTQKLYNNWETSLGSLGLLILLWFYDLRRHFIIKRKIHHKYVWFWKFTVKIMELGPWYNCASGKKWSTASFTTEF